MNQEQEDIQKPFSADFGVVVLKEWMYNPTSGQTVLAISGRIKLSTAKSDFGFQPKGTETNWAVVVGHSKQSMMILGCQIRGVYLGDKLTVPGIACWNIDDV